MSPPREGAAWLGAVGAGLVAFGWWGTETHAGRHRYDEMAGMIPFFAGLAGFALLVVALALFLFSTPQEARYAPAMTDAPPSPPPDDDRTRPARLEADARMPRDAEKALRPLPPADAAR